MKRLLCALLFLVSTISVQAEIITMPIPGAPAGLNMTIGTGPNALPLVDIRTNPSAVNITTSDDWYNEVPLGFTFPFYGRNFTTSWAATNGFVTFVNPQLSGLWGGCCQGVNLNTTTNPTYNYTIYGLHTDLYSWNGQNQYYLRGNNEMTYGWYNLSQCCSSQGGNSFEIKINSAGVIDTRIAGAMVNWNAVTSGMAGDLSKGERFQYYHGQGMNITPGSSGIFSWNTNGSTGGVDPCIANPLSSTSCSGYAAAYQTQQCSINPLYNATCPGYAQAYHDQQCTSNQLSYTDCPGYAAAYLTQQCTASALYSPACPGYQQAYFTQQCTASALYNSSCPGYQQAYFTQQCSINPLYNSSCPGYARAYHDQQCSLSALYATDCPGYQEAYQAQQFAQACRANSQSSPRCPGYVTPTVATTTTTTTTSTTSTTSSSTSTDTTAGTTTAAVVSSPTTSTVTPTSTTSTTTTSGGVVTSQSTTAPASAGTVSASGTLSSPTAVPVIADPVVNNVVSNNSQTTTAVTATSAVAQSTAPAPASSPTSTTPTTTASTSTSSSSSSSSTSSSGSSGSSGGSATQNTRAALVATLTRPGGAAGMSGGSTGSSGSSSGGSAPSQSQVTAAAGAAMKDADTAGSMEQQAKVQNVVLGAMAYVPGFDVYNVALRDVPFYKPYTIYGNQRTVDNRNAARRLFGATDIVHEEMVQQQFKLGN